MQILTLRDRGGGSRANINGGYRQCWQSKQKCLDLRTKTLFLLQLLLTEKEERTEACTFLRTFGKS